MRRIHELGVQVHIIGAREASREEYTFCQKGTVLDTIPRGKKVYLSIDMDLFDCEDVGNYVPGGISFNDGVAIIKEIIENNEICGFDICEVTARTVNRTSLTAAKLLYTMLTHVTAERNNRSESDV
jgi:arginase family enzyme